MQIPVIGTLLGCILLMGILFVAISTKISKIRNKAKQKKEWLNFILSFIIMGILVILAGWIIINYTPTPSETALSGIVNLT